MPEELPAFQRLQYAFAAAVRGAAETALPDGVSAERMSLYRELIFHNLESFVAAGFPVLHELLPPHDWESLMRDFVLRHRSTTPYFSGIPAEFLAFLQDVRGMQPGDPPFLLELAHYEWVELALSVAGEEPPEEHPELMADPLGCRIMLSPVAWPLVYEFPVHRIGRDHQPACAPPEPTWLTVYRGREDLVRFLEINPATYRLLQAIDTEPGLPATVYLEQLARELGYSDAREVFDYGAGLLRKLAVRGVIGMPAAERAPGQ